MNELGNVNIRETPWMDIEYSNVQMTVGHHVGNRVDNKKTEENL